MTNARLEELRAKFQENPRRYFAPFANELRKTGDPAQAIQVCRAHLASQPGHVSGHIVLGQALYEAGEGNEARDVFTAALELDPENLIALRSLGEIAQVNGDFGAARQWYERLLEADPRNTEVSQLIRDLPTEKAIEASQATAPIAEDAHAADRLPFNARPDSSVPEPIPAPPAPTFHTSFTGSSPVIGAEPSFNPAQEPEPIEAPVAREEPRHEPEPVAASHGTPVEDTLEAETIDMIDFDSIEAAAALFAEAVAPQVETADESFERPEPSTYAPPVPDETFHIPEPVAEASLPDESLELPDVAAASAAHEPPEAPEVGADEFTDVEFGGTTEAIEDTLGHADEPPAVAEAAAEAPAPEPAEPSRAIFAEFGFDGPVDDQLGWMTTPSAALSDLESAPESWFDEESTAEQPAPEQVEEAPVAEFSANDHPSDSWFDDVEGASNIEATEVTNEEFWLPPELNRVIVPEQSAEPEPEPATSHGNEFTTSYADELNAQVQASVESADVAEADDVMPPAMAASETHEETVEPYAFAQDDNADHAESAPYVDHSMEMSSESYWAEPVAEPAPAMEQESPDEHDEHDEHDVPSTPAFAEYDSVTQHEQPAESEPSWMQPAAELHEEVGEPEPVETQPISSWSEPLAEAPAGEAFESQPEPVEAAEGDSTREGQYTPAPSLAEASPPMGVVMGLTPASVEAIQPPPPAPFVTETLAELYLQQGFREEAVAIYRQLVERDPNNASIRDRLDAIGRGQSAELAPAAESVPVENRAASQSVRTFFSRLARRPAVTPNRAIQEESARTNPEVPFAAAASALANLFAASKPPASDEGAASTLAGAFTDPAGRPSRAAERELSLDHLFRDVPPGGSASGGVSLDEFYGTPNATPGSPTEPGEASESGEASGTDIRQFTAWLEGLRKK